MSLFMSKLVSIVFHPIFMPLFTLFLLFNSTGIINQYYSGLMTAGGIDLRGRVYLVFFITTVLMPAISFYILKRNKLVSSFSMPYRHERFFPYLTTLIYYFILYYLLRNSNFPAIFKSATLGTILVLITVMVINFWMKISSHAAGIAGVAGIYAILMKHGWVVDGVNTMAVLIILTGIVCAARLSLNAHRGIEIIMGLVVGFGIEFLCMNFKLII